MPRVVMLRTNPYRPDPAVRRGALVLREEGYDILLLAWDREDRYPRREDSEGIEVRRVKLKCSYDNFLDSLVKLPLLWFRMLIWLLRDKFDILHCHDFDTLPVGLLVARLKGRPCVFDAHEIYSAMVSESVPAWVTGFLRWAETILVPYADLVVTANETFSSICRGMGARKVVVVMNCPPAEEIANRNPESVRRTLGLEGREVCLYAGMLERSRNLDTLMKVFDTLEDENIVLVLGGYGSLVDYVQRRVSGSKNIMYVGWIAVDEMTSYISAADVVLLLDDPSFQINRLATATRLLQAIALGVPVLASQGTSSAKIVQDEAIGLCVRYDDVEEIRTALHRLLYDTELRKSMIENCLRASRERYSWEIMERRLIEAYGQLLL